MLHGSACISTCISTVLFHLCNTSLISTSFSPPILLTRRITRHSTCLPRAYNTLPSRVRRVPGSAPTLLPATRSPRPHNVEPYKKSNLKLELRWLKDPVRLADRTVKLLQKDDFLKALEMVRLASKDVECTVSWNHLIDYEMGKARVTEAIKLYNEVSARISIILQYQSLMPAKDEEACTAARFLYLHHTLPRLVLVSSPFQVHLTCSLYIPVHVRREQPCQTVHYPYQCGCERLCSGT